ncbi:ferredoxin [Promicromonospora umidemergens]|uniref:Ferredoxin n=1 Tax=Promicromonospora umidemergens TaxID=629679 RepID=A0ABP8XM95_9MICO|nr:ferredoxin [Promicromonospora umidemergens]MCP2282222.1 ferredoxin [Promicromonospora umidemergens]
MLQIDVDADSCVGAGQCTLTAPDVFDQDDSGIVMLLTDDVPDTSEVREAAALCPARAIKIRE